MVSYWLYSRILDCLYSVVDTQKTQPHQLMGFFLYLSFFQMRMILICANFFVLRAIPVFLFCVANYSGFFQMRMILIRMRRFGKRSPTITFYAHGVKMSIPFVGYE